MAAVNEQLCGEKKGRTVKPRFRTFHRLGAWGDTGGRGPPGLPDSLLPPQSCPGSKLSGSQHWMWSLSPTRGNPTWSWPSPLLADA